MPAPSYAPRKRFNRKLWIRVGIALLFIVLLSPFAIIARNSMRQTAHDDAVEELISHIQLDQQDSMMADTWQAGYSAEGVNYVLMSFRQNNQYVKEFLATLPEPTSALVMFIDNRAGREMHSIDFTTARLHFVGNHVRAVPDQFKLLNKTTANRAVAVEALAPKFDVLPERLVWGKILLIPPDTDLRTLLAVTVKIDNRPVVFEGTWYTSAQKEFLQHGIYAHPVAAPTTTTLPATQPASDK